jgi:hypothetical protein
MEGRKKSGRSRVVLTSPATGGVGEAVGLECLEAVTPEPPTAMSAWRPLCSSGGPSSDTARAPTTPGLVRPKKEPTPATGSSSPCTPARSTSCQAPSSRPVSRNGGRSWCCCETMAEGRSGGAPATKGDAQEWQSRSERGIRWKEQGIFPFRSRRGEDPRKVWKLGHASLREPGYVELLLPSFSDPTGQSFCNDVATPSVEGLQEL